MVSSLGLSSITVTSPAPCLELRPRTVWTEETEDSLDGGNWRRLSRPNDFLKLSQRNLETEFLLACSYSELPSCCWMYRIFSSPEGGGNVCTRWPDSPWCGEWCWWCGDWAPIVPANTSLPPPSVPCESPSQSEYSYFLQFWHSVRWPKIEPQSSIISIGGENMEVDPGILIMLAPHLFVCSIILT